MTATIDIGDSTRGYSTATLRFARGRWIYSDRPPCWYRAMASVVPQLRGLAVGQYILTATMPGGDQIPARVQIF